METTCFEWKIIMYKKLSEIGNKQIKRWCWVRLSSQLLFPGKHSAFKKCRLFTVFSLQYIWPEVHGVKSIQFGKGSRLPGKSIVSQKPIMCKMVGCISLILKNSKTILSIHHSPKLIAYVLKTHCK